MAMLISTRVSKKLANKHNVTRAEICECFEDRSKSYLIDPRAKHASNPPTRWFIAQTDLGRALKVCFIFKGGDVIIRTAFPPNRVEIEMYDTNAKDLTESD